MKRTRESAANLLERSRRMMSLLKEMSLLQRMINSPGLDEAFNIVKGELPSVVIHEYPSGMECGDWIVPPSWHVSEGYMEDKSGNRIASIEESKLFVAPYSEPVDGWFTKEEIAKHVRTRADRPDAFVLEHRIAYNYEVVDWGITLPHNRWLDLPEGEYHVKIEIERQPTTMKVAEYFVKGSRPDTLCICAHIDELCNDDLSGCVVAMGLMHHIEHLPERNYSYQMLLVPEMFGPLFFLHENPGRVRNMVGMLNLETLGAGVEWCLKKTFAEGHSLEEVLRAAMRKAGIPFKEIDFFDGYGNDERIVAWPTFAIPGVALQRYPFAEYHTSDDTPEIINVRYLEEALTICKNFVDILENDYIPEYTRLLPPWLTRRGLYYDSMDDAENFHKFNNLVLFNVNGMHSVLDLARIAGLGFFEIQQYLDRFVEQGLINRNPVIWRES